MRPAQRLPLGLHRRYSSLRLCQGWVLPSLPSLRGWRLRGVRRKGYLHADHAYVRGTLCRAIPGQLLQWMRPIQEVLTHGHMSVGGAHQRRRLWEQPALVRVPRLRRRRAHPGPLPGWKMECPDRDLRLRSVQRRRGFQRSCRHLWPRTDLCADDRGRWRVSNHTLLRDQQLRRRGGHARLRPSALGKLLLQLGHEDHHVLHAHELRRIHRLSSVRQGFNQRHRGHRAGLRPQPKAVGALLAAPLSPQGQGKPTALNLGRR
jgi:hypothetical protein